MENALKYERYMRWAMIVVIGLCTAMFLLDLFSVTTNNAQIGGPVACFTVSIYSLGRKAIKEFKGEIERLKSVGVSA